MKVFMIFAMLITFSMIFASSNIASGLPIPVLCEYHNPRINLTPTKEVFSQGEPIRVNAGTVPEDVLEVIVKDPKNMVMYSDIIKTDSSGDATIDIPIPQKPVRGTWEVFVISHSDESQKVVFVGVGQTPEPHLAINPYQITHADGKNVSATFLVAGESKQSASIKVFDSKGNNVYRNEVLILPLEGSCNYSIDMKGFELGEYTIALLSGNEAASAEFNIGITYGDSDSTATIDLASPLKQFQSGVSFNEIRCKDGLVLVQKYNGNPACVTESTKQKLIERGWTTKDSSAQKIIERLKKGAQPVNDVDARYIETLALMNQTVSNFVYGVDWTSHCCGYSENNGSYEITITFLDSDNRRQLGVTIDLDTMQITDIQHGGAVSIGKGLSNEPDPYMLVALREFPNESAYYHKLNSISEIPYLSEINENKTTIITSEQFDELLEWFPQKCLENNSDSYNCSDTPSIFEYDTTKYLIVSHELDSTEVYCESGLLYVVNYEKEFSDRKLDDFVPVTC